MKKLGLAARAFTGASLAIASAAAVELFACSSSSPALPAGTTADGGGDGSPVTTPSNDGASEASTDSVTTACTASAKARCTENDTCTNGTSNKMRFGDESTCEARLLLGCEKNLAAAGTGATAATVASCAASIPGETCAEYRGNEPAETCIPPAGTVAIGGSCAVSAQCVSTYCAVAPHAPCGTCATPPALSDDCSATQECGARGGLVCNGLNRCVQRGGANAACTKDAACGPDLTCVTAKDAGAGSCVGSANAIGATCDHKRNTGPDCDAALGLFCNPTTDKCVAYTFAAANQPCGEISDGFVACTNGTCVETKMADGGTLKTGTCAANASDGQACDVNLGPGCQAPARCIVASDASTAGTCTLVDPTSCK